MEGETKTFSGERKLRKFVASQPTLQKQLQTEKKQLKEKQKRNNSPTEKKQRRKLGTSERIKEHCKQKHG